MFIDQTKLDANRIYVDQEVALRVLRDGISRSDARYAVASELGYRLCTMEYCGWRFSSAHSEEELKIADSLEFEDAFEGIDYEVNLLVSRTLIGENSDEVETAQLCLLLDQGLDLITQFYRDSKTHRLFDLAFELWDSRVTCARIIWIDPRSQGRSLIRELD